MLLIFKDFAKRDIHRGLHDSHNARALHRQFPRYTLDSLYRIRRGEQPKYMRPRTYLTLKLIMEFADYHNQEARKLTSIELQIKYGISENRYKQLNKEWKGEL